MNKYLRFFIWLIALNGMVCISWSQDADAEGCKDHPMLSRMNNFYITECESNYDQVEMNINEEETQMVEGEKTYICYELQGEMKSPSRFQVRKNYIDALKKIGGTLLYEAEYDAVIKVTKGGKEIWTLLRVYGDGESYCLTIVEKKAMEQEVQANDMLEALNKNGFIALYITFDIDKATIKSESEPIIEQIIALLKDNPDLQLSIEGHTDNTGTPEHNKTLSGQRAKAVMDAVIKGGIAKQRLSAVGWGQDKPVADNRSEEGRAKNRRVEIVKK